MVTTVAKTIGSTGVFSTLQLWEDGAPADLTTAEKSTAGTFLVASFVQGETINFVGSGAVGKFLDTDSTGPGTGTYIVYGVTSGNIAASDVATGATSGATCIISSGTPTDTGVIWQGQCQNQEFTAASATLLTISGETTSSSSYVRLQTVSGASFKSNANVRNNLLSYNSNNGACLSVTGSGIAYCITFDVPYTRIYDLQCSRLGSTSVAKAVNSEDNAIDGLLNNLICECDGETGVVAVGRSTAVNCFFVQRGTVGGAAIVTFSSPAAYMYNCTLGRTTSGIQTKFFTLFGGDHILKNCAFFSGETATSYFINGSGTITYTTCYTDVNSPPSGVTQVDYASTFRGNTDSPIDFRLADGSALIDTGTTDATNAPTDISGTARPQGAAYDVGCWEHIPYPQPKIYQNVGTLRW